MSRFLDADGAPLWTGTQCCTILSIPLSTESRRHLRKASIRHFHIDLSHYMDFIRSLLAHLVRDVYSYHTSTRAPSTRPSLASQADHNLITDTEFE